MIKLIGYFLMMVSAGLGLVSIGDVLMPAAPGRDRLGAVAAFALVATPVFLIGMGLVSRSKSSARRKQDDVLIGEPIQQRIWELANARNGRLSPAQLAQDMGLRQDRAERELRRLASHGHAELRIDPDDGGFYVFTSPVDPDEWALDITDA